MSSTGFQILFLFLFLIFYCSVVDYAILSLSQELTRQNMITETLLCTVLEKLTKKCRKGFKPEVISMLEEHHKLENETLERDLHSKADVAVSLPRRLSGDKQWRISRSKYPGRDGLSCSSCPVRLCVDENVSNIYDALGLTLSQFVESSFSISSVIDALKTLRRILIVFQKCSFKSRKTINSSLVLQPSLHNLLPIFGELLDILQLKCQLDTKNEVFVHLVGHPVKASLALPVALDALNDVI